MRSKRKVVGPLKDLYRQCACLTDQLAEAIFTSADTSIALEQLTSLRDGNYLKAVSATVNPMDYTSADTFSRDYLCVELMSKYPCWELGIDRPAVALAKFIDTERKLASINLSENPRVCGAITSTTMRAVESTARIKIAKILSDFSWNNAFRSFAFGPGASTSLSRRRGDASFKFGAKRPQMSYNVELLASAISLAHPSWSFDPEVVSGSRLVTVPKNAKTDRSICIEPDLNMYVQKGIGRLIRSRLQRWNLLLPDAQERNALLAKEGSLLGLLATVDLSNASDSISMDVVRLLLPPDWVFAIEQSRSPTVVLPSGDIHLLRKVSSMGNGFTFELETLIFYGIVLSVIDLLASTSSDHRSLVFGDDIIISSDLVGPLDEVLVHFGFELNRKKTFSSGPFRESCGKHYFSGSDVTPFYFRDRINTVHRKYWAANTIRRYSYNGLWGLDARWRDPYDLVISSIPDTLRSFKIPEGVGDNGLTADFDIVCPSRSKRHWDAFQYTDVLPLRKDTILTGHGVLLKALHSMELSTSPKLDGYQYTDSSLADLQRSAENGSVPSCLPRETTRFRQHKGWVQQWPNLGPWI